MKKNRIFVIFADESPKNLDAKTAASRFGPVIDSLSENLYHIISTDSPALRNPASDESFLQETAENVYDVFLNLKEMNAQYGTKETGTCIVSFFEKDMYEAFISMIRNDIIEIVNGKIELESFTSTYDAFAAFEKYCRLRRLDNGSDDIPPVNSNVSNN